MLIYSVTVSLDAAIEEEWLRWMMEEHIPDVMSRGYFYDRKIRKLLYPEPESGMVTYNIQYSCESIEKYNTYSEKEAPELQSIHMERYKDRFIAFRTLLEVISY